MPLMSPTLPEPAPLRLQSPVAPATASVSRMPDEQDTDYPDRPPVSPISPVIPFAAPVNAVSSQTSSAYESSRKQQQQQQPAPYPPPAYPQFPTRHDHQPKQQQRQPLPQSNFTFQFQAQQLYTNPDEHQNGDPITPATAPTSAIPPSSSYNRPPPYQTAPLAARQQLNYSHQQQPLPQSRLPPAAQQHQWQHQPHYYQQPQHQANTIGSLPTLHTQSQGQAQSQSQAHSHTRKAQPKDSPPKTTTAPYQQSSFNPPTAVSAPSPQSQTAQQPPTNHAATATQSAQPAHTSASAAPEPSSSAQVSSSAAANPSTQPLTAETPPNFIPSPSNIPISESTNPDVLALRSAISILQIQRQKALRDITALQSLKTRAGADPAAFRDALMRGDLKHERNTQDPLSATFQSDIDEDSDEEPKDSSAARQNGDGTEHGEKTGTGVEHREEKGAGTENVVESAVAMDVDTTWPAIPVPQTVVRCPPVNWNKYHVAGEALDRLHEERRRRPDPASAGREHAVAARYDPFVDLLDGQGQAVQGHGRRGSGAAGSDPGALG